jgi:DHA2 family multidrug resistance protein
LRPGPPQTKKEDEKRCHFHWNRLIEDINPARPAVQHFLDMQAGRLNALVPGDAGRAAVQLLANLVQREALVMTYNDAIMMVGTLFAAGLFLMPLVGRRLVAGAAGH